MGDTTVGLRAEYIMQYFQSHLPVHRVIITTRDAIGQSQDKWGPAPSLPRPRASAERP